VEAGKDSTRLRGDHEGLRACTAGRGERRQLRGFRRTCAALSAERELPQQRLLEHCRLRGLECLDLLEPLRRAQAEGHVYHLRDTHWNAGGNRVAGTIIGEYLSERLARSRSRIAE
jgi:hypothetical protein